MSRDELLEKIKIAEEYLKRTDLTESQREKAETRYDELRAELRKMDVTASKFDDPRAKIAMEKIRSMLGMEQRNGNDAS